MDNSQLLSQVSTLLDTKFSNVRDYFDSKLDKLTNSVDGKLDKLSATIDQQGSRLVVMETQLKFAADDKARVEKLESRIRDLEDTKSKALGLAAVLTIILPILSFVLNRLV